LGGVLVDDGDVEEKKIDGEPQTECLVCGGALGCEFCAGNLVAGREEPQAATAWGSSTLSTWQRAA